MLRRLTLVALLFSFAGLVGSQAFHEHVSPVSTCDSCLLTSQSARDVIAQNPTLVFEVRWTPLATPLFSVESLLAPARASARAPPKA